MINFVAIFLSTFAVMALGAFWYSPFGFGKAWEALAKPKGVDAKKGFLMAFVLQFFMAFVFANIIPAGVGPVAGIMLALWMWAGFIGTTTLIMVVWEGRSIKLWLLDNSYHIISMVLMGSIVGGWV